MGGIIPSSTSSSAGMRNRSNVSHRTRSQKNPWAYGAYSDGTPINKEQRLVYRERTDLQACFPDPFDASTYLGWWNTQGRIDFPDLFKDETRDLAMQKLSSQLTPGFRGGAGGASWGQLGGILWQSISHPRSGLEIGKRGWEVLRTEGIGGVMRKARIPRGD